MRIRGRYRRNLHGHSRLARWRGLAAQVPSSPDDLSIGVIDGVRDVLTMSDTAPGDVERFVHGTTVATNAVLETKGARVGLLMTEGFEDVLELGSRNVPRCTIS